MVQSRLFPSNPQKEAVMSNAPLLPKARLVLIPSFMLLALALALSSTSGSVSARPASAGAPDKAGQSDVPTESCWLVIPSANPPTGDSRLNGVATLITGEVWAVGSSGNQTHTDTLIEHSIGGNWDIVPSPSPGSQDN